METFQQIDSGKFKFIKGNIRLPMILLSFIAGVIGGLQTSFLNGMCLSLQKHGWHGTI
jgi:uncharacterized integral membrane protein